MNPANIEAFEVSMVLTGCALWLWVIISGRARRWFRRPDLLPRWNVDAAHFLGFATVALFSFYYAPAIAVKLTGVDIRAEGARAVLLVPTYAGQIALIALCLVFRFIPAANYSESTAPLPRVVILGICAIVFVFPVVAGVVQGWDLLLKACGVIAPRQDLIGVFRQASRPGELTLWITLVAVLAPLSEELFFRGCLFRFLGTKMPIWWAAFASSVMWALLHDNLLSSLPLVVFGMMLCVLYQKSGRILASIIVHGLFNLNTVLVALYGPLT